VIKALFVKAAQSEFKEARCDYEDMEVGLGEAFAESVR
jgi:hypothetical protein